MSTDAPGKTIVSQEETILNFCNEHKLLPSTWSQTLQSEAAEREMNVISVILPSFPSRHLPIGAEANLYPTSPTLQVQLIRGSTSAAMNRLLDL